MDTIEANIKITREKDKHVSVSVNMPIWNKRTEDGNLKVMIPFLGIDTIASNEADAESAVGEAICSFCIVSDKFGRGIEKELQELGWTLMLDDAGDPVWGYSFTEPVLDRIVNTGESYVNDHLELESCD